MLPRVSILILNYNGIQHLDDCLNSVEEINYPDYEVILIDNASDDGSVDYVKKNYPWVKTVVHSENLGFCEGYNRSIEYTDSEYLALLNNDTSVDKDWLVNLVSAADESKADISGSRIMFYDKPEVINHIGARITPIGSGYDMGFGIKDGEINRSQEPVIVGAACGAALLIKKEKFLELGGFDPDYFAYFEDLDLCWRAWLKGYRVIHVPDSIIYHKFGGSWGRSRHSYLRTYYGQKNRLANIIKNFQFTNVVKGLLISLIYDIVLLIGFLITGQFKNILALVRGTISFIKDIPKTLKKRRRIQRSRVISDKKMYKLGLISSLPECIRETIRLERLK